MATGTIYYWNGISGWIRQSGVENLATSAARDVMLLQNEVDSGTAARDSAATFTIDAAHDPWLARDVTVS
jgi:hypothetical protein